MKTNFEDLDRLNRINVPVNIRHTLLSDNPIQNIITDLADLEMYEQLNVCRDIESIQKWLKINQYIKIPGGLAPTKRISDLIEEAEEYPTEEAFNKIPSSYGIRSKVIEILYLKMKIKKENYQMIMEL